MTLDKSTKILIVGLGVIGGGYATSLTASGYDVCCITKNESDISYAIDRKMIKNGTTEVDPELVGKADLIIFALYPTVFIEWVEKYQSLFKSGAIITDVTGVKGEIVSRVQGFLRKDVEFISSHPMAGREQSGVEFSDPNVFVGANYIITPTEKNTPEAISVARELGRVLGFGNITELSVEEHDKMIAFLSQLTHCIAVSLMTSNSTPNLEKYTGDSFRDLTRIAKINEKMWSELFVMNKSALLIEMDRFIKEFCTLRDMIEAEDKEGMQKKMIQSTQRRMRFDKPKK